MSVIDLEVLHKIASLRRYVDALWSGTTIRVEPEDIQKLKEIYAVILPSQRLSTGCNDCIKYALIYSQSYWEREWPRYVSGLSPKEEEVKDTQPKSKK